MGQDIHKLHFSDEEVAEYQKKLAEETKILKSWFDNNSFCNNPPMTGIELEAWLVDNNMLPSAVAVEFIEGLNNWQVVPEISRYNFELNSCPYKMEKDVLSKLFNEVNTIWKGCEKHARDHDANAIMMGTLATLRPHMLNLECMSPNNRYLAMNEQVMKFRHGKPLHIYLEGKDQLDLKMDSVISECAATSLQIHIGVNQENAKRYYNASIIASSLVVAVSANSPYYFGYELWDESRIAAFEQAVEIDSFKEDSGEVIKRVTLGNGYIKDSFFELFQENIDSYPILLPEISDEDKNTLPHLRLHNGTIWRWNRPIIGVTKDGAPHLRVEQRTPSAGPTVHDSIANAAFYLGLVDYLANLETPPEDSLSFKDARDNFYKASKQSLYGSIKWIDGNRYDIQKLMLEKLLPQIKSALEKRNFDKEDLDFYIDNIIKNRLIKGINGARWQKAWVHTHGKKFQQLLEVYLENQLSGKPVHEWRV